MDKTEALEKRIDELERTVVALTDELKTTREEATFFQRIFDAIPFPLVIFRSDGLAVAMNRQNELFIHTPRESVVGVFTMYEDAEAIEKGYVAHFEKALAGEVSTMSPTPYDTSKAGLHGRTRDTIVWSETTYFPLRDETGQISFVGEISLDVTNRKQIEQSLWESETRFRNLAENAHDIVFFYRLKPSRSYEYVSPAITRILGYTPEEFYADPSVALKTTPQEEHEQLWLLQEMPDSLASPLVIPHIHRNGTPVWLEMRHRVVYDNEGEPIAIEGISRDITEHKKLEMELCQARDEMEQRVAERTEELSRLNMALQASEERHRIISELTSDYIYGGYLTLDGQVVTEWVGGAFERITGYRIEEIQQQEWLSLIYPDDIPSTLDVIESVQERRAGVIEYRIRNRQGELRWLRDYVRYLPGDGGERKVRMVGAVQNITREREIQAALQSAREAAETANRAKSEFLATMSHEIRTPLNAIIGMSSILLETSLDAWQRECVEISHTSGKNLLVIINDILDFARMETRRLTLEPQPFNLRTCIEDTLMLFSSEARRKNLGLSCTVDEHIPSPLVGDVARIRQIISNLVSNGIKFTKQGSVTVQATLEPGKQEQGKEAEVGSTTAEHQTSRPPPVVLHIRVSDTGIGISPEQMPTLFQTFCQLDASTTRSYGGTGLGLMLSKRLAEMMGGTIWVESEVGKGSTFHVRLSVEQVQTAVSPAKEPGCPEQYISPKKSPRPLRILLAEDNPINQKVVLRLLEHLGYRAGTTSSGLEVLEVLEQVVYDVILMDVQMPEMDGMEATRRIRTTLAPEHQPWIIAMTASMLDVDREQCLSAGMNDYLSKPVRVDDLAQALRRVPPTYSRAKPVGTPLDTETFSAFLATYGQKRADSSSGSNTSDANDLLRVFLLDTAARLADMHKAAVRDEYGAIHRLACELRTSSNQIGAFNLSSYFQKMVEQSQAGWSETLPILIAQAEDELERVRKALLSHLEEKGTTR
jgi:PAS domain S-box-containing protein